MRRSASEKMETIRIVDNSDLSVRATLQRLDIARSTFYGWHECYRRLRRARGSQAEVSCWLEPDPQARAPADSWRSTAPSCHLVSWLATSRTMNATSCPNPACTAFSSRTTSSPARPTCCCQRRTVSRTRPGASTSCGRPTSPTFASSVGAGLLHSTWPVDHPGRLFALHHRLEALANDGRERRSGHARPCARRDRRAECARASSASAAFGQRSRLCLEGAARIPARARHDSHARRAVSPHDPRARLSDRSMKAVVKLDHYYFPWQLKAAIRDFLAYYN